VTARTKSHGSQGMRTEIITLRCLREIIFWMSKVVGAGTFVQHRNSSQ
jgi:hypothetical protein